MVLASSSSCIKLWNTKTFQMIDELKSGTVYDTSWNKDGTLLAALNENSDVSLLNVSHDKFTNYKELKVQIEDATCVCFGKTTGRFLALGGKNEVLIWDACDNIKKKKFRIPGNGVTKLSFSRDDSHFVTGTSCGSIYIASNVNNVVSKRLKVFSEQSKVTDIEYSLKNRALIGVSGENGSVSFVDSNKNVVVKEYTNCHSAPATSVSFSPVNEMLAVSVGFDKKIQCFNAQAKSKVGSYEFEWPLSSVSFLNDGSTVALGTIVGHVLFYDLRSFKSPLAQSLAHDGHVFDLSCQPLLSNKNSTKLKSKRISSKEKRAVLHEVTTNVPKSNTSIDVSSNVQIDHTKSNEENSVLISEMIKQERSPTPERKNTVVDEVDILSPLQVESRRMSNFSNTSKNKSLYRMSLEKEFSKSAMNDSIISDLDASRRRISSLTPDSVFDSTDVDDRMRHNNATEPQKSAAAGVVSDEVLNKSQSLPSANTQNFTADDKVLNSSFCQRLGEIKVENVSLADDNREDDSNTSIVKRLLNDFSCQPVEDKFRTEISEQLNQSNVLGNLQKVDEKYINSEIYDFNVNSGQLKTNLGDVIENCTISHLNCIPKDEFYRKIEEMKLEFEKKLSENLCDQQFAMREQFSDLFYKMSKQIFDTKKQLFEKISENSLNVDLISEIERLRDENDRLRCNY